MYSILSSEQNSDKQSLTLLSRVVLPLPHFAVRPVTKPEVSVAVAWTSPLAICFAKPNLSNKSSFGSPSELMSMMV